MEWNIVKLFKMKGNNREILNNVKKKFYLLYYMKKFLRRI